MNESKCHCGSGFIVSADRCLCDKAQTDVNMEDFFQTVLRIPPRDGVEARWSVVTVLMASDPTSTHLCVRTQISKNGEIKKCNQYLVQGSPSEVTAILGSICKLSAWIIDNLRLGDIILFTLNVGHTRVLDLKIRNFYLANFVSILYDIKNKTGYFAHISNTNHLKGNVLKKFMVDTNVANETIKLRSDKKKFDA